MKPCFNKRKLIAWLAVDALDARAEDEVRAHLEICAGCRGYLAEISRVKERLAVAVPDSDISVSASFHPAVLARLEKLPSAPVWETVLAGWRAHPVAWRVALPLAAVLLVLIRIGTWEAPRSGKPGGVRVPMVAAEAGFDLTPSIANYQQAISQSPDQLDALLTRQEKPMVNPLSVYTAAARSLEF